MTHEKTPENFIDAAQRPSPRKPPTSINHGRRQYVLPDVSPYATARAIEQLLEQSLPLRELELLFRARVIAYQLARHDGNQCAAARALGLHRNTLARHIAQLEALHLLRKETTGEWRERLLAQKRRRSA